MRWPLWLPDGSCSVHAARVDLATVDDPACRGAGEVRARRRRRCRLGDHLGHRDPRVLLRHRRARRRIRCGSCTPLQGMGCHPSRADRPAARADRGGAEPADDHRRVARRLSIATTSNTPAAWTPPQRTRALGRRTIRDPMRSFADGPHWDGATFEEDVRMGARAPAVARHRAGDRRGPDHAGVPGAGGADGRARDWRALTDTARATSPARGHWRRGEVAA